MEGLKSLPTGFMAFSGQDSTPTLSCTEPGRKLPMTDKEKKSPVDGSKQLNSKGQQSTDLDSRADMIERLMRNQAARIRFVDSHLAKGVAFQIQSMRGKKQWSQEE